MKASTGVGVVIVVACVAFAGWRLGEFRQAQRAEGRDFFGWPLPQPAPPAPAGGRRVAAAGAPVASRPPPTRPAKFFLRSVARASAAEPSQAEWQREYPAFAHEPVDRAGFCAVSLPWRFASTEGPAADPAVAHALAFLLSYDLEWSPASYGTRHAFFVFKRSRARLADADGAYDPKAIATVVREWNGTHALGGILVHGPQGYVATLQVFDRDGRPVHERAFEQPRDVFAVLGDVSAEALRFFGTPAGPELDRLLRRPRCKDPAALAAVGKAAFAAEGSAEEFGHYRDALAADPEFAEARLWAATQRWWLDGDDAAYVAERARVLAAAPHVAALADDDPAGDAAAALGADPRMGGWVDRVEALAGKDHPTVVSWRLRQADGRRPQRWLAALSRDAFRPFVAAAGRNPNHRGLLLSLVEAQQDYRLRSDRRQAELTPYDAELTASLCVTSIHGRSLPPAGRAYEWFRLAEAARTLGRPEHVVPAVRKKEAEPDGAYEATRGRLWLAEAQMELGDFDAASGQLLDLATRAASGGWREHAAARAAVLAVLMDRRDVLVRLTTDPNVQDGSASAFYKACLDYLDGKPVPTRDLVHPSFKAGELLVAERELAEGGDFAEPDRRTQWDRWAYAEPTGLPDDRLKWILLERYYALEPGLPHAAGFYETSEWLLGHDPYVRSRVAAWRAARGSAGPAPLPTADEVIANLTARQPKRGEQWPEWVLTARLRRDLEEGRPDDAKRLLASYLEHQGYSHQPRQQAKAALLARRVAAATAVTSRPLPAR